MITNVGAIFGGLVFGYYSDRMGRRRAMITSAICALVTVPLWVAAPNTILIALGGFLIQFFVQGAWGVIPAHLTELSPDEIRGFYPGVTYQLGNLLAALNLPLQTSLAESHSPSFALLVVIVPVLVAVIVLTALGSEAHSARFGDREEAEREPFATDRFTREPAPAGDRLRT
jgi:SHS family lactate transporter-like MFS transporter